MHPIVPVAIGTLAHVAISFVLGFIVAFLAAAWGLYSPEWLRMVISELGVAAAIWVAIAYYRSRQARMR